jgi:hypothetical protein
MPTYKRTAVTAKEGINFIRSAVESAGSLFVKIEHENDIGIDALIEFIADERPLNKQIAVQIKSGASYYVQETGECVFPVGDHRDYWVNHPLPVVGLVYVPALESAFWASIKGLLKANPETTTMRFSATEANRFDARTFSTIFVPQVVGSIPDLEFDEALRLARSETTQQSGTSWSMFFCLEQPMRFRQYSCIGWHTYQGMAIFSTLARWLHTRRGLMPVPFLGSLKSTMS